MTDPHQPIHYDQVSPFPEPLPVTREMMTNMMMSSASHGLNDHTQHQMDMPIEPTIVGDMISPVSHDLLQIKTLYTIEVPPGATAVADFDADASGQWFFHCHHLFHMLSGMSRIFQYTTIIDIARIDRKCRYRYFLLASFIHYASLSQFLFQS